MKRSAHCVSGRVKAGAGPKGKTLHPFLYTVVWADSRGLWGVTPLASLFENKDTIDYRQRSGHGSHGEG
ncbi:MAG: hypothetical protein ACETVU_04485, partial [Desulfatiglandales bacterium]